MLVVSGAVLIALAGVVEIASRRARRSVDRALESEPYVGARVLSTWILTNPRGKPTGSYVFARPADDAGAAMSRVRVPDEIHPDLPEGAELELKFYPGSQDLVHPAYPMGLPARLRRIAVASGGVGVFVAMLGMGLIWALG